MLWIEIDYQTDDIVEQRYLAAVSGFGNIFIPAMLADSEQGVYLAALNDDIRTFRHQELLYAPADWLAEAYPHCQVFNQQVNDSMRGAQESVFRHTAAQPLMEATA